MRRAVLVVVGAVEQGNERLAPLLSPLHQADVRGDAVKPGAQLRVPAEGLQFLEGGDEGVLVDVVGLGGQARADGLGQAVDAVLVAADEAREGLGVPVPAEFDEFSFCLHELIIGYLVGQPRLRLSSRIATRSAAVRRRVERIYRFFNEM